MRTRTRRKIDGILLVGAGLAAAGAGASGAFQGGSEQITSSWSQAVVAPDGSAQVTEVIDWDFGALAAMWHKGADAGAANVLGEKHGILRVVPDLPLDAPVVVESDAPDNLEVSTTSDYGGGTQLKIGDPDQAVSGVQRYRIDYPLPGVAVDQKVAWDGLGFAWSAPVERAEVHLVTPYELVEPVCYVGEVGSRDRCDVRQVEPGHVTVTVRDLDAQQGVTLEGVVGAPLPGLPALATPPATPPEAEDLPVAPAVGIPAGVALTGAAVTGRMVRRAGRERVGVGGAADAAWGGSGSPGGERRVDERELAQMATTEFAPPGNLRPHQGGLVLAEEVQPEHKVAWLIEAAIGGAVELVEDNGKVVQLRRLAGERSLDTAMILDSAFAGRSEIPLGAYDKDFAGAWDSVGSTLEAWYLSCGFWDTRAELRRKVTRFGGATAAFLGLLATVGGANFGMRGSPSWFALSAGGGLLMGVGLAAWIRAWEMRVRTPEGSAAWLRTESFRRFLAGSEAYHAEEAAKRGVLREYTAWAVALGEIDRWARAVKDATIPPSESGYQYVDSSRSLMSTTSSTASAPSSSGGGGGGGGAGGGGGGSW